MGDIESGQHRLYGYEPVNSQLGSALASPEMARPVLVSHDIYELVFNPVDAPNDEHRRPCSTRPAVRFGRALAATSTATPQETEVLIVPSWCPGAP